MRLTKCIVLFIALSGFYITAVSQEKIKTSKEIVESFHGTPDWQKTLDQLVTLYGKQKADSLIQSAKVEYYFLLKDYPVYIKEFIKNVQVKGTLKQPRHYNSAAWHVFQYATDAEDLALAESWITTALKTEAINPAFLDTKANILYKSGNIQQAITTQWFSVYNGLSISTMDPAILVDLFKMKAGLPTWKYPETIVKRNEKADDEIWLSINHKLSRGIDSLVWQARFKENQSGDAHVLIRYVNEFKPQRTPPDLNGYAWAVLEKSNTKTELETALAWSKESLKMEKDNFAYLDTYANLLYKLGRKKEAIECERKALALCPEAEKPFYQNTLDEMKKGKKTWPAK